MSDNYENDIMEDDSPTEQKPPKKRTVSLFSAVILILLAVLLTFQITFVVQANRYDKLISELYTSYPGGSILSEIDEIYSNYYVGEIDDETLKNGILEGYVFGSGDKYGNYMTKEEYEAYSAEHSNDSFGIGISITPNDKDNAIDVLRVHDDSSADKAGMLSGDVIVLIDGKKVSELGYEKSADALLGEAGSKVTVTVDRAGEEKIFELTRGEYKIDTVDFYMLEGSIGYVRITNFYEKTPTEFKDAVNALIKEGAKSLLFDVRNNGGGRLDAVREMLDFLLPEGVIVRMSDKSGKFTSIESDANCIDLPMAVLVNGNTASASELFASALSDYDKAQIIGTKTYGKGTVTTPYKLSNGGVVYVSAQLYYPPVSDNFEGVGITPDTVVDIDDNYKDIHVYKLTYEQDAQMQKAVETLNK